MCLGGVCHLVLPVVINDAGWKQKMDSICRVNKPFWKDAAWRRHTQTIFPTGGCSELQPLVGDLRTLLRALDTERRFADDATITWSPDTLRRLLHKQLAGERIIVVSNREPYIHMKRERGSRSTARPAAW